MANITMSFIASSFLVGCSNTSNILTQSNNTTIKNNATISLSSKPVDGSLASVQEIKTYQSITGTDVKLYKIFYWSQGVRVEALMTEPSKPGKYPLLVNLHGGAAWVRPHWNFGYTAKTVAYVADSSTVMLYPEYEGYMESEGTVHGIKTDTLDVLNAISAAKEFHEIKAHDTYLIGYSLGGGLALMTAAADHEVKAVVAISPFVGLKDFVDWAKTNVKSNTIPGQQLKYIEQQYGTNTNSQIYQERSPDIKNIQAPVLLLQGDADKHVAWQTVQTFAKQMKSAHRTVKFVLYKGGEHVLQTVPYQAETTQEMDNWLATYGLKIEYPN